MSANCVRCGSEKPVPNVALADRSGDMGNTTGAVKGKVHGDPGAWLFKDTVAGTLPSDVYGECGDDDSRVGNARDLYEKYRKTAGQ